MQLSWIKRVVASLAALLILLYVVDLYVFPTVAVVSDVSFKEDVGSGARILML